MSVLTWKLLDSKPENTNATIITNATTPIQILIMPHILPAFADEHKTPFVSRLDRFAKIIARIAVMIPPTKKDRMPQTSDAVAREEVFCEFGLG